MTTSSGTSLFLETDRGLFLETDRARLTRRLTALCGEELAAHEVARLASGDVSLLRRLPLASRQAVVSLVDPGTAALGELESIVGSTIDYVPIAFLDHARRASLPVVRVVDLDRQPVGTGILVSQRVLLTNNHVTRSFFEAMSQLVQFRYELRIDGTEEEVTEFRLDPTGLFVTSLATELDATLVAVGERVSGSGSLADFGYISLTAAADKHAIGDFVTLIHHPRGDFKQIALRENRVIGRGRRGLTLHYAADTLGGSSGSPVFNDHFELVALHHAGGARTERNLEDGRPVPAESNEGIRISAIVHWLREQEETSTGDQRSLVRAMLERTSVGPAPLGQPGESCQPSPRAAGTSPPGAVRPRGAVPDGRRNAVSEGRLGYALEFLGPPVPLPQLGPHLVARVALPEGAGPPGDPTLAYTHFTAVQDAVRAMPFFVAVNIDERQPRALAAAEPSSAWYVDPRLSPVAQLDPILFDHASLVRPGPLARPVEVAWGSPPTASQAQGDTFHLPNCCPEAARFRVLARVWSGVEEIARHPTMSLERRITKFAGPVCRADDPIYRGTLLPRTFWKVIVRFDPSDGLRATALLGDQSALLAARGAAAVAQYQVALSEVAGLTGLSFGPLEEFDTLVGRPRAVVQTLDDVSW